MTIRERLRDVGLEAGTWANGPHDRYPRHAHDYDKVLVCETGSISFGLVGGDGREGSDPFGGPTERIELRPGDRLDLPARTQHDAVVGPDGVTCLEAHVAAGTLGRARRLRAGEW